MKVMKGFMTSPQDDPHRMNIVSFKRISLGEETPDDP